GQLRRPALLGRAPRRRPRGVAVPGRRAGSPGAGPVARRRRGGIPTSSRRERAARGLGRRARLAAGPGSLGVRSEARIAMRIAALLLAPLVALSCADKGAVSDPSPARTSAAATPPAPVPPASPREAA